MGNKLECIASKQKKEIDIYGEIVWQLAFRSCFLIAYSIVWMVLFCL